MNTQPLRRRRVTSTLRRVHPHIVATHYDCFGLFPPSDAITLIKVHLAQREAGETTDTAALMAIAQVLCLTNGGETQFSEPVERE